MKLSIIVIGDEILIGQVTDTNSGFISRILGDMGWQTQRVLTVGDKPDDIRAAVELCMADSDLVITTGGLGPTKDDITKGVLLKIFGGRMVWNREVSENIHRIFRERCLDLNRLTEAQAIVPDSCRVIQNKFGTAPIMWFEDKNRHVLIAMPGVPFETEGMIKTGVLNAIRHHFTANGYISHRSVIVTGITESALAEHLEEFENSLPDSLHLAYLPAPGLIRLRLDVTTGDQATAEMLLGDAYHRLCKEAGDYVIYRGDATAAEIALDALRKRGYHMASAESCTGGYIAHSITRHPGCSDVYYGTVVSYANSVKCNVLGVYPKILEQCGAVSSPAVAAMSRGVARLMGVECAVATSGIAGPNGALPDKPVGTVWMAVTTPKGTETFIRYYNGSRQRIIEQATNEVLLALARRLYGHSIE